MKTAPNGQKLRGGFYTPPEIAEFLVNWAIQKPTAKILEPSCGDGVFFQPIVTRLSKLGASQKAISNQITAVELDGIESKKAFGHLGNLLGVKSLPNTYTGDFFAQINWHLGAKRYNTIVGNPPFIRYQNFPEDYRETAFHLMRTVGLHPTKLTNAWLPFVAMCTDLLAENGRIAMVVPAELLQVNYAAELRQFLHDRLDHLTIITFRYLVFKNILQEVVLICGERNGGFNKGIRIIEIDDIKELKHFVHPPFEPHILNPMDHSKEKWTQYFLAQEQNQLIRKMLAYPGLHKLGQLADVDVGIVTGLNDFFVLNNNQMKDIGAEHFKTSLVSRSGHLKGGIEFTKKDWRDNIKDNLPAYLLTIPATPLKALPRSLSDYIKDGQAKGYHEGYKCRIRDPWYQVPSIWIPDAFMLRQIHDYPKIIVNSANATSTDTIHRVRLHEGTNVKQLAGSFFNSLTFAFAEIFGRSYGGGVLELEPSEAERLPIPYDSAENLDFEKLNHLIREGESKQALEYCDSILLIKGLGLKHEEVFQLQKAGELLRNRRLNRKPQK
jgi:adenine-specific DNA-methyltransferase